MKLHKTNIWAFAGRSSNLLGLSTIALSLLTAGQAMAQLTWTGATSTAWNESGNWVDTVPAPAIPADGTVLNFGGSVYGTPANLPTNNDIPGPALLTTGAINFTNNSTVAASPIVGQLTQFTLGAADLSQSIILGGTITTTTPFVNTAASLTDTINLNLVLNAPRTITTNRFGSAGATHNINIFGLISGDGLGAHGLTKGGGANLSLANTANSFSGELLMTGGSVTVTSLQPSGTASSIGTLSAINLSNATLVFGNVGTAPGTVVAAIAPTGPIDRVINLSASGGINIEISGTYTFSGTFNNTTTSAKTLALGGNVGTGIFQGNLANNTGILSFSKGGGSTWILSGANTHTGGTLIDSGTLSVSTIADSGSSNLGPGTSLRIGNAGQTATLNYTGATGASTGRQLTLGSTGGTNNGGSNILNSGAINGDIPGAGLKFTNPNFNAPTALSGTTRTLTLAGSNTDANEISGIIINGTGATQKTALLKTDGGRWLLSNPASTYLGTTFIHNGILEVKVLDDVGVASSLGAPASTDSTIRIGDGATTGTLVYTGTGSDTNRQIQIGNRTEGNATGGSGIRSNGGGPLEFTNPAFNSPVNTGTTTVNPSTTRTLFLSGTNTGVNRITGVIADNLQIETPIVAVAKEDIGLWVLEGANTYTGQTSVQGGTLRVNTIADSGTSALGFTGQLTLAGGTLSYSGASAAATARNVVLSAASTIDLPSGSLDISDGTSGAFVLTKTGTGVLVLSGLTDNNSLLLNAAGGEVQLAKDNSVTPGARAVAGITGIGNGATVKLVGPGTDQIFGGNGANQGVNGIVAGGTLDLNGRNESISFLNGTGGVVDGAVAGGTGTTTLVVGEGNVSSSFAGVIQNTTGTLNLQKEFAGTQTLAGSNTYTGTTAINFGTLILTGATQATSAITSSGPGKLGLDIGSSVTAANATVTFTGRTVLVTGTPTLPSYTLLTANSIVGTPTFAAPAPAGYSLSVVSNQLLLVSDALADPFLSWAGNDPGVLFDGDQNNDGVENGLAWLLGASGPNVDANGLLPIVTESGGSLKLTFDMLPAGARGTAQLFIEHSSDLGIGDLWASVLVPDTSGVVPPVTFVVTDSDPIDPDNELDVEATISSSEAVAGKLFSRLKAVR